MMGHDLRAPGYRRPGHPRPGRLDERRPGRRAGPVRPARHRRRTSAAAMRWRRRLQQGRQARRHRQLAVGQRSGVVREPVLGAPRRRTGRCARSSTRRCTTWTRTGSPRSPSRAAFAMVPGKSEGLNWLARHQGDPRQPWKVERVDAFPTSHHVAWADFDGDGAEELVNAPLIGAQGPGADLRPGQGVGLLVQPEGLGPPHHHRGHSRHHSSRAASRSGMATRATSCSWRASRASRVYRATGSGAAMKFEKQLLSAGSRRQGAAAGRERRRRRPAGRPEILRVGRAVARQRSGGLHREGRPMAAARHLRQGRQRPRDGRRGPERRRARRRRGQRQQPAVAEQPECADWRRPRVLRAGRCGDGHVAVPAHRGVRCDERVRRRGHERRSPPRPASAPAGAAPSAGTRTSASSSPSVTALWRYAAILVVAAGVSRLPQLTSPHLLLDGDEAILGLMAKHLAEGREAPIFFYGQAYGLSFFEAAAGAVAFRLAGVGDVQLKLAMLAIWLVGVVAFFAALARLLGPRRSFWAGAPVRAASRLGGVVHEGQGRLPDRLRRHVPSSGTCWSRFAIARGPRPGPWPVRSPP